MRLFEVRPGEGYEWVQPVDPKDFDVFRSLDEHVVAATWTPLCVRRIPPSKEREAAPSDFPWLGNHVLVMRERAVAALTGVLRGNGDVLPLVCGDGLRLFAFNARIIAGGLDEGRSSLVRFRSGRIMQILRPSFVYEAVRSCDVFRVPDAAGWTYVSERFVRAVESAQLVGLEFDEVWASEDV